MKTKKLGTEVESSGIHVRCSYTELVDVVNLVPHPRNPNKHPDSQIALLAKVIRHQGWRSPIVVSGRSGFVISGHGRLEAAKLLQVEKVPVDRQDFLTEADETAHLLADNRLAELAEIDGKELAGLLTELKRDENFDMDLAGFDKAGLEDVGQFNIDEVEAPELKGGDREPFQQMTFTLHDSQVAIVKEAIGKAKGAGHGESDDNENSNGSALAHICGAFLKS